MKVRFANDYRHNYLVVAVAEISDSNKYAVKMITENQIEGLLHCQERNMNGETFLYYEITSKQNMKALFEIQPVKMSHLQSFFRGLQAVNDEIENYLLNGGNLLVNPEYIFCDLHAKQFFFLFYPENENTLQKSFQEFLTFLMSRMDSEDVKMVEAVYQMADLFQRQQFVLDEILIWFMENFGENRIKTTAMGGKEKVFVEETDPIDEIPKDLPLHIQTHTPRDATKYPDFTNSYKKSDEFKRRIWDRIRQRLFGKKEKGNATVKKDIVYRESFEEEVPAEEDDRTVYIPWVENSDNKLYGIGKGNKYHISLTNLPFTVGKMSGAVDLVIRDPSVSRLHARFSREGNHFYMTDLNSTNGTFRNGIRLEPNTTQEIEPGDEIGIGKLKFIYR